MKTIEVTDRNVRLEILKSNMFFKEGNLIEIGYSEVVSRRKDKKINVIARTYHVLHTMGLQTCSLIASWYFNTPIDIESMTFYLKSKVR